MRGRDAIIIVNFTAIKKGREIRDVSLTAGRGRARVHRDSPGENVPSAKYINVMADSDRTYVAASPPSLTFSTARASKFNKGICIFSSPIVPRQMELHPSAPTLLDSEADL